MKNNYGGKMKGRYIHPMWIVIVVFAIGSLGFAFKRIDSKDKDRPWLGVSVIDVSKKNKKEYDLGRNEGIQISYVVDDSPADFVDLERGDLILSVDGSDLKGPRHFTRLIRKKKPGDKLSLKVIHDGKNKTIKVELASYKDKEDEHQFFYSYNFDDDESGDKYSKPPFSVFFGGLNRPYLGIHMQDMNEDLAKYFNVDVEDGVLITDVEEDSPAEEAGMKPGDILSKIDGESVEVTDDILEILGDYDSGEEVEITVVRSGKEQKITVELGESNHSFGGFNVAPHIFNFRSRMHSPDNNIIIRLRDGEPRIIIRNKIIQRMNDRIHDRINFEINDNFNFHYDLDHLIQEGIHHKLEEKLDHLQDRLHDFKFNLRDLNQFEFKPEYNRKITKEHTLYI